MNHLQTIHLDEDEQTRNNEIKKVYFKILQELVENSNSFPTKALRTRVEVDHKENSEAKHEIYEFLTPCIFCDLNADPKGRYYISYALNDSAPRYLGQPKFTALIRIIYNATKASSTKINIEDRLEYHPYYSDYYDGTLSEAELKNPLYTITTEEPKA